MQRETKNYCDQAKNLVAGGIIRTGVQHPWMDHMSRDTSRVRVVDFAECTIGEQDNAGSCFSDARHLNAYLSAQTQEAGPRNRKLIIIEGLEPRILELVGVRFGIPASFFLGHCDQVTDINIVDRACAKPSNPAYWRVGVPQARGINTAALEDKFGKDCYGSWNVIAGNAGRLEVGIQPSVRRISFRSLVSYWGMSWGGNEQASSWTGESPSTMWCSLDWQVTYTHSVRIP